MLPALWRGRRRAHRGYEVVPLLRSGVAGVTFWAGVFLGSFVTWLCAQAVGRLRERELSRWQALAAQRADRENALRLALDDARRGLIQARQIIAQTQARDAEAPRRAPLAFVATGSARMH
jgi:hypothetical protein